MNHRLVHLDCLRGLAALLVVVEHLRAFLFVPYAQVKVPGVFTKLFYLVTGLGHQAVMIFFVLSGFLVRGSVITALQKGKWSRRTYLLRRMSRLCVVLIPALLASRSGWIGEGADLLIGIGCAALVAGLATRAAASYFYGMLSAGASEISYTLYLVHFPVLAFLFFGFFKGSQMTPGPTSGSWFAITLGGVILYSVAAWWLFERNTDRFRKAMERSL